MSSHEAEQRPSCTLPSWSIWRFMAWATRPCRGKLMLMAVVMFIWAFDEAAVRPYLIKLILDSMRTGASHETSTLVLYAVIYVSVTLAVTWSYRCYDWLTLNTMPQLRSSIVDELTVYTLGQSHAYHQDNFAGSLSSRISGVADAAPRLIEIVLERFMSTGLRIVIALATLWFTVPAVAVAAAIWTLCFLGGVYMMSHRIRRLASIAAGTRAEVVGSVVDVMSNSLAVRLFCGRSYERKRLRTTLDHARDAEIKRDWALLLLSLYQGTLFAALEAISLCAIVIGYSRGIVSAGDAALIFSINLSLIMSLWGLSQDGSKFMRFLGEVSQGLRALTVPHEMVDAPDAKPLVVRHGSIEFRGVSFSYMQQDLFFPDISITIPGGQKVGLVGYSGSGKSTFVNLILRLFDVDSGEILIDGQNIALVTQDSLRAAVALIPQDPVLFHRSLYDNIRYGNIHATSQEVCEAAQHAHAHEFIIDLPEGYHTPVGERGLKLSGGQRQRIAIARAFLKKAPILIMDEATSALDSVTEQHVQEGLELLMEGRTTLVIAHRLSTLLKMDRILVFDRGVIVEDGAHAELLARQGLYHQLWHAQIGGFLPERRA